ncbi:DUF5677 domain-containing protein [Sulfuricurvum sp.]|uniref:DUF5677 domain-containing protein n=1 Tax=Sulfuricurvum sp. TaxID=2025608 RepID=UPI002E2F0754|nr:DUF5677 domain-containing protein [Sulfuricurvum sp.]HEX5329027.1 DUF5677 domain-containing protein [Sulfuricurvum sp.]
MQNSAVKEFEQYHQIKILQNWKNAERCVEILAIFHKKLRFAMGQLQEDDFHKNPTVAIVFQLINRIYEQINGGISCICTKNHASSEVLSRTAIESSVNVLFFLKDETDSKVFSWLKKYIDEDMEHISDWEKSLTTQEEKDVHLPRIQTRRMLNEYKKDFVQEYIEQVKNILNIDENFFLPKKILKRFQEVGHETTYHTVYTRLSATTHLNAEDTISYMMAKISGNKELELQIGLEASAFSEFMQIYALFFYGKVVEQFYFKYATQTDHEIAQSIDELLSIMNSIGAEWDW